MKMPGKTTPQSITMLAASVAFILLGMSAARAAYPDVILADHPVAYYRLEDTNGNTTATDSSGNGFDGYITYVLQADGITTYPQLDQPGLDSNSVLFATSTGTGQGNIDVPVNSTINPTTADGMTGAPFSAEMWVLATKQPGNFEVPLEDSSDFSQPPPYNNSAGWNFYQTAGPGSTWSYSIRPNPGYVGSGPAVVIGQWTHLVLTYDGTNAILYVNGAVGIPAIRITQFLANNGSRDLIMGEGPATGFAPYDGGMDEVAIYNYALSLSQVTNHYMVGTNSIRVLPTPPSFNVEPANIENYAGIPVTFSAQAIGTAPIVYQWVRQGVGPIPGATNTSYTITPVYPADNGAMFFVTATNSAGGTNSTLATLTVDTNLAIADNPFSITRRTGGYAAFRTVAVGAVPITYQWHRISNSIDLTIAGATNDTYWLSNLQASADGTEYYAVATEPFGSVASSPATLSVITRTSAAPVSAYSKIVMADSPVGYWRLDETNGSTTALDAAGSFDGTYAYVGSDLTFGYASGIPHEIDTAIHVTNTATVTIPYALELNPVTGPWSYEFWIQPTSLDPANFHTPISSEGNQNSGANLSGWNIYQHVAGVWTWNIYSGGGGGSFTSEFTDNPIVPGTWYHMVLTDDGTNMNWYSNDRLVLTESVKGLGFVPNGINGDPSVAGGPITIGVRSDGVFGDWDGGVDDVAVYNYVLSAQQIQNHFLNSTHLTVAKSGGQQQITWPVGTLQSATLVQGPYTNVSGATSPFTITNSGPQKFYRVSISQ